MRPIWVVLSQHSCQVGVNICSACKCWEYMCMTRLFLCPYDDFSIYSPLSASRYFIHTLCTYFPSHLPRFLTYGTLSYLPFSMSSRSDDNDASTLRFFISVDAGISALQDMLVAFKSDTTQKWLHYLSGIDGSITRLCRTCIVTTNASVILACRRLASSQIVGGCLSMTSIRRRGLIGCIAKLQMSAFFDVFLRVDCVALEKQSIFSRLME